jgi:YHS domain-containing protein
MRVSAWLACFVLAIALVAAGCGKKEPAQGGTMPPAEPGAETQGVIAQKMCPVMNNEPIDPKVFVDYNGRRIYFCCPSCPPVFNKDPEKYIKIVDEQLKAAEGKSEKK